MCNSVVYSSIVRENRECANVLCTPVLIGRTQSLQMYCVHHYPEDEHRVCNCVVNSSIGRENRDCAYILCTEVLGGKTHSVQVYCVHQNVEGEHRSCKCVVWIDLFSYCIRTCSHKLTNFSPQLKCVVYTSIGKDNTECSNVLFTPVLGVSRVCNCIVYTSSAFNILVMV